MYKFSKITGCFYPDSITYADLPSDLIPVSEDEYIAAMNRAVGETLDVVNEKLFIVPAPPNEYSVWTGTEWVPDKNKQQEVFERNKQEKLQQVSQEKEIRQYTAFPHQYKDGNTYLIDSNKFAVDAIGLKNQDAVRSKILLGGYQFQPTNWKTYHDLFIIIDTADDMLSMQNSLSKWFADVFDASQSKKNEISSAMTQEELDLIDVKAGWPQWPEGAL